MSHQNQHNRPEREREGCVEVSVTPQEAVRGIASAAYTENVVIANTRNACADNLPSCGFAPLSDKEQRQAYVREIAAPLFEGSPPLMAYLDRSSYRGDNREFDGRVSAHNMHDFLKTYETMSATGQNQWPYTEKNAQYVRDLLDFKYPELTGPNFAGFSAQALARRAGLTKMSVKNYGDYAALQAAWKQATQEDASFRGDVEHSREIALPCAPPEAEPNCPPEVTVPVKDPVKDLVKDPVKDPCDVPAKQVTAAADVPPPAQATQATTPGDAVKQKDPCDVPVPPAPPAPPCDVPVKVAPPCEAVSPCDGAEVQKQHDRELRSRLEEMSTFKEGGSYWRMANRWLHAGMKPGDHDDISNRDISRVTKSFLELNHATVTDKGLPNPMCHPGDRVPIPEHLAELAAKHEKLARALERMLSAEQ